jgi:ketosteroid isomerase-like protein
MQPIQQAITGGEGQGDLRQPYQALVQFYAAFNGRDLRTMAANWDNSSAAVLDNPLGGIKRGWDEFSAVYLKIFNSPAKVRVEFFDYTIHEAGDLFYAVGRERGEFALGDERLALAIRTTRVFRRVNGIWNQVHHHGSIDDPQLLERYQKAVLRGT